MVRAAEAEEVPERRSHWDTPEQRGQESALCLHLRSPLTDWVALDKSLNLCGPQFPHRQNRASFTFRYGCQD